jgi:hypothetical protein
MVMGFMSVKRTQILMAGWMKEKQIPEGEW